MLRIWLLGIFARPEKMHKPRTRCILYETVVSFLAGLHRNQVYCACCSTQMAHALSSPKNPKGKGLPAIILIQSIGFLPRHILIAHDVFGTFQSFGNACLVKDSYRSVAFLGQVCHSPRNPLLFEFITNKLVYDFMSFQSYHTCAIITHS